MSVCLFVCGLLCTSGCTTAGASVEIKQAPPINLSQYKTIAVAVTTRDPDFDAKQIRQLTDSILGGLRKSAKFDKAYATVSEVEPTTDLKLSVIVQFVVGPNRHRVQSIESTVALIDLGDGRTLGSANINSHTEWALFGGNMHKAIASLGDQIVDFVIK